MVTPTSAADADVLKEAVVLAAANAKEIMNRFMLMPSLTVVKDL
ncbi:hypothetical protein [Thiomicrorhabdus sp.]